MTGWEIVLYWSTVLSIGCLAYDWGYKRGLANAHLIVKMEAERHGVDTSDWTDLDTFI